jgi:hypothetical protein
MSLQLPVLDDTDFEQLLQMALDHVDRKLGAEWKAASEGDPGRVLIELFAYLSDQVIYRLNRLPAKVYIAFLRLLGLSLYPPAAAEVTLAFTPLPYQVPEGLSQEIEIPRGTRVTVSAGQPGSGPVFVTLHPCRFPLGQDGAENGPFEVRARHCTWVKREALGRGTGQPGLCLQVAHPPIVAPFDPAFDVQVWVEVDLSEGKGEQKEAEKRYRRWHEVSHFGAIDGPRHACTVDRSSGKVCFAPAARTEMQDERGQASLADEARPLAAVPARTGTFRSRTRMAEALPATSCPTR